MLQRRLASASVLLVGAFTLIGLDVYWPVLGQVGVWMLPLYFFFALGTAYEIGQSLQRRWTVRPSMVVLHCSIASFVALFPFWYSLSYQTAFPTTCPLGRVGWLALGILTGLGTSGVHALWDFQSRLSSTTSPSESTESSQLVVAEQRNAEMERTTLAWFLSSFVVLYVVGCMSFWILIRMHGDSKTGMLHLIALLTAVKSADTGAYFAGKMFGRTKLCPSISPGKTIEGLAGGLLASVCVSYLLLRGVLPGLGVTSVGFWWGPALLGTLLTFVGLVGDLLESMVKRTVGAKDSGAMLPGLGGVWDVTDSLLPAAIVGYLGIFAKLL